MDSKDWVILNTIYEEKNITKAAEKLFISQPTITYHIKQIETEFGKKILLSDNKGVQFTAEGYYLVDYCKHMISEEEKIKRAIMNANKELKGSIKIGCVHSFSEYKLPLILKEFLKMYPDVNVNIITASSYEIINKLRNDEVNICFENIGDHNDLKSILVYRDALVAVANHPIKLKDLPNLTMIDYDKNEKLKNVINSWWKNNFSVSPSVSMDVCQIQTCKEMIKCDIGFSIIPEDCIRENDNLFSLKLLDKNGETLEREVWLTYRQTSLNIPTIKEFVGFVKKSKNRWNLRI